MPTVVDSFILALALPRLALYVFDYGAPVGLRVPWATQTGSPCLLFNRQCLPRRFERRLGTVAAILAQAHIRKPARVPCVPIGSLGITTKPSPKCRYPQILGPRHRRLLPRNRNQHRISRHVAMQLAQCLEITLIDYCNLEKLFFRCASTSCRAGELKSFS